MAQQSISQRGPIRKQHDFFEVDGHVYTLGSVIHFYRE